MAYITTHVPDPRTAPLCGNSIATDRGFLARDMPRLDNHLHYRMIDVSSIKELCRRWYPRVYFGQPPKGLAHRALADIRESIRELEYYRRTLFVPLPGPDVEAAKAIGAELSRETDTRHALTQSTDPRAHALLLASTFMVAVAQLAEHRVVVPGVVGSNPISHPMQLQQFSPGPRTGAELFVG